MNRVEGLGLLSVKAWYSPAVSVSVAAPWMDNRWGILSLTYRSLPDNNLPQTPRTANKRMAVGDCWVFYH
ncbi:hypothetical protein J6590_106042 [Homalodisca vitripennis]|nr:hypothetical protein J6590_106042 [Homalodisca vitripennis]